MGFCPGDLIFTADTNIVAKAIRWATTAKGEQPSEVSHVAGFVSGIEIVEAHGAGTEQRLFSDFKANGVKFEVWRHTQLTILQRFAVAKVAKSYVGRKYGFGKIATHLGDALLGKISGQSIFFFRRINHLQRYPICSWVWAWAYREVGYDFGIDPAYADPDDMRDHVLLSSHWRLEYAN